MSVTYQCGDSKSLTAGVDHAARVAADGECIVLPTDTVYGIGCDAFSPMGVQALLGAKGRTREMPPPVLIPDPSVLAGLADQVSQDAHALAEKFWPGALTIVCWAQPTLGWDLGETHGTVALRVPDDDIARRVLERVGPMAVSSANLTGMPAAQTAERAREMLEDRVALYLDDGPRPTAERAGAEGIPSTIVDCTGDVPVVLRHGAISLAQLRQVVPHIDGGDAPGETGPEPGETHGSTAVGSATGGVEQAPAGTTRPEPTRKPAHRAPDPLPVPATSDADVAHALVESAPSGPGTAVDQNRNRWAGSEPRWRGTAALGVDEASSLVNGG